MFFPEALGLGYGFLQYLINGQTNLIGINFVSAPILVVLLLVVHFKIVATSFTVGSGGSAGVFAPSLVIGGFVGAAFWIVLNSALPGSIPVPAPLVLAALDLMTIHGIGRLPVVSRESGKLACITTRTDVIKATTWQSNSFPSQSQRDRSLLSGG